MERKVLHTNQVRMYLNLVIEWRKERVGQNLPLSVTSSGHYTIPITRNQYILEKVRRDVQLWTTLSVSHLSNEDIVNRLHNQFSLPPLKC